MNISCCLIMSTEKVPIMTEISFVSSLYSAIFVPHYLMILHNSNEGTTFVPTIIGALLGSPLASSSVSQQGII